MKQLVNAVTNKPIDFEAIKSLLGDYIEEKRLIQKCLSLTEAYSHSGYSQITYSAGISIDIYHVNQGDNATYSISLESDNLVNISFRAKIIDVDD